MSILEVNLTVEERCAIREEDGYFRGKEEGELNKAKEIAKNLKNIGLSADVIAENTGLTAEAVEAL